MKKDSTYDPITQQRARELVDRIWMVGDDDQNAALIALLAGIADCEGDMERYNVARAAMRHGFLFSRVGDAAFTAFVSSAVKGEYDDKVEHEEDDPQAENA